MVADCSANKTAPGAPLPEGRARRWFEVCATAAGLVAAMIRGSTPSSLLPDVLFERYLQLSLYAMTVTGTAAGVEELRRGGLEDQRKASQGMIVIGAGLTLALPCTYMHVRELEQLGLIIATGCWLVGGVLGLLGLLLDRRKLPSLVQLGMWFVVYAIARALAW